MTTRVPPAPGRQRLHTKRCSGCEQTLPVEAFSVKKRDKDGTPRQYNSLCRPCKRVRQRAERRIVRDRMNAAKTPVDAERACYLPIGPLRRWLEDRLGEMPPDSTVADLAKRLDCNERAARAWLWENNRVHLGVVDRLFCGIGEPYLLNELYPVDGRAAA